MYGHTKFVLLFFLQLHNEWEIILCDLHKLYLTYISYVQGTRTPTMNCRFQIICTVCVHSQLRSFLYVFENVYRSIKHANVYRLKIQTRKKAQNPVLGARSPRTTQLKLTRDGMQQDTETMDMLCPQLLHQKLTCTATYATSRCFCFVATPAIVSEVLLQGASWPFLPLTGLKGTWVSRKWNAASPKGQDVRVHNQIDR